MEQIKLIDSHAHLMDEMLINDVLEINERAKQNGIEKIINVGYSIESSKKAVEFANTFENMYAVIGVHPDDCNMENVDFTDIVKLAQNKKVLAIGEIGLDYHYEETNKENQKKHFIEQIQIANELKLPVSIHSRDADMDMLEILKNNKIENGFVMHCFSSSVEILKEELKLGAYISLAGPVTFKNARSLIEVAKIIPSDKILVETDCPYLCPEPYRGQKNEPSMVYYTAQKIAELRKENFEYFSKQTYENTKRFYKIFE